MGAGRLRPDRADRQLVLAQPDLVQFESSEAALKRPHRQRLQFVNYGLSREQREWLLRLIRKKLLDGPARAGARSEAVIVANDHAARRHARINEGEGVEHALIQVQVDMGEADLLLLELREGIWDPALVEMDKVARSNYLLDAFQ